MMYYTFNFHITPTLKTTVCVCVSIHHYTVYYSLIFFFTPTKSDITRNTEYKLCIKYSKTNVRKFTFSNIMAPAWKALVDY